MDYHVQCLLLVGFMKIILRIVSLTIMTGKGYDIVHTPLPLFHRFWSYLSPYCPTYSYSSLPLSFSFSRGNGASLSINGQVSLILLPWLLFPRLHMKGCGLIFRLKAICSVLVRNCFRKIRRWDMMMSFNVIPLLKTVFNINEYC